MLISEPVIFYPGWWWTLTGWRSGVGLLAAEMMLGSPGQWLKKHCSSFINSCYLDKHTTNWKSTWLLSCLKSDINSPCEKNDSSLVQNLHYDAITLGYLCRTTRHTSYAVLPSNLSSVYQNGDRKLKTENQWRWKKPDSIKSKKSHWKEPDMKNTS